MGQNKMVLYSDPHSANKPRVCHPKNILESMGSPIYTPNPARASASERRAVRDPCPDTFIRISILDTQNADGEKHCSATPNPL